MGATFDQNIKYTTYVIGNEAPDVQLKSTYFWSLDRIKTKI